MNSELWLKYLPSVCKFWNWITHLNPKPTLPTTKTALVVEDNQNDAYALGRLLRKRGIQTEIVSSAEVAQGVAKHALYDIMILDVRLPGMYGTEVLPLLSEISPNAKFVVVCGEPSDLGSLPSNQFIGFIKKPIGLESVEEMLKQFNL